MPYPGMTILPPPVFTLYGDGLAVFTVSQEPYFPDRPLVMEQTRLSEAQVNELLRDALDVGGLAAAEGSYDFSDTSEQLFSTFTIDSGAVAKSVSTYGLGEFEASPSRDRAVHDALNALAIRLRTIESAANDLGLDTSVYEPDAYEATLSVPFHELEANADWPWPELAPADFGTAPDGNLIRNVTPAQAAIVFERGGQPGFIATAPTGVDYVFHLDVLLPDQRP
jgi:hypothetical protein